jgi:hypothetical protein
MANTFNKEPVEKMNIGNIRNMIDTGGLPCNETSVSGFQKGRIQL